MPFTPEKLAELAGIVASDAPVGILLDLRHPNVDLNISEWRKELAGTHDGGRNEIARRVINAYDRRNAIPQLAISLYRRLYRDDVVAARLIEFTEETGDELQQAALRLRASSMHGLTHRQFWADAMPRVCVIVSEANEEIRRGTGFLLGPDLILTAYHVVGDHIREGQQIDPPAGRCFAIFDHFEGAPIEDATSQVQGRWVPFHDTWLEACSPALQYDGKFANPNAADRARLQNALDFALVRLAEPVGRESYTGGGGRARSWFTYDPAESEMQAGQRVLMPQHPFGFPQKLDVGFFVEECPSGSRLRSDIEASKGSSGAPCFRAANDAFPLVGMHNAAYAPRRRLAVMNQAIKFAMIADQIGNLLQAHAAPVLVASRLWNVSPAGQPSRPILGRTQLLKWLEAAPETATDQTVFASISEQAKSGRAFSIEILRAARRESGDRIIEFGTRDVAMPATAPDMIHSILEQLAIPAAALADLPPRPSPDALQASDKLEKWASDELPHWLEGRLREHREQVVDARDLARQVIDLARALGRPVSPEDQALADSPAPKELLRTRWDRVWFAMRLTEAPMRAEVATFIAGLMGRNTAARSATGELARLRWLFIGTLPNFLNGLNENLTESLNPMAIGVPEFVEAAEAVAESSGYSLNEASRRAVGQIVDAFLGAGTDFSHPESRLAAMQRVLVQLKDVILSGARS